jgi:hypothetical protein
MDTLIMLFLFSIMTLVGLAGVLFFGFIFIQGLLMILGVLGVI